MRSNQKTKVRRRMMESLEARELLSVTQLNYPNFTSTTGFATNGYASAPITTHHALILTDGGSDEARDAIFTTKVPIDTFTSHFSYVISPGTDDADGITFVIENDGTTAIGANGFDLAYSNGTFGADSVALAINTYNLGSFGSSFGFASGGQNATTTVDPSPVDFHAGDSINATVTYDGTTLAVTLVDATTQGTFTDSEAVNLPQVLGGNTAYVGFTGATGNDFSTQHIESFGFSGTGAAPTITTVAAGSPASPTGTKDHLSVVATSNSGGTLSYAWSVLHVPPGAAVPTFSVNNSSSASITTARFSKAGTYRFRCTVTDSNGGSTVSDVSIVVQATPTGLKIEPHKPQIVKGTTEQFIGRVYDQFGHKLATQPTITYAVVTGTGSINALTGLYTASGAVGHLLVSASADDLTGVAGATVVS